MELEHSEESVTSPEKWYNLVHSTSLAYCLVSYNMIAQLDNGKEVLLPDPVEVVPMSYDLEMTIPGSIFADEACIFFNSAIPNMTIEVVDDVNGVDDSVTNQLMKMDRSHTVPFQRVITTTELT